MSQFRIDQHAFELVLSAGHAPGDDWMVYRSKPSGRAVRLAPPAFEIDGERVVARPTGLSSSSPHRLPNGCDEWTVRGSVAGGLTLVTTLRAAPDSPVVRLRYALESDRPRRLTKAGGADAIEYARASLDGLPDVAEVRLGGFVESVHSYMVHERPLDDGLFANGMSASGPILLAGDGSHQLLLAYEHGSMYPDDYLRFDLSPDRSVSLRAVKGNYLAGQVISPGRPFETVWLQLAAIDGTRDALARHYRHFVLERFAPHRASRAPHVFYNTWNFQERNRHWNGKPYLESMTQDRILAEIDVAHRMGIEVFVLDTGWYAKTGDWRVNTARFDAGLKSVKAKLDGYGMRLGLWFDNAAAVSSEALTNHRDCVMGRGDAEPKPWPVWETEEAFRMCLASRYWEAFADELIRLSREVGVTYFKWDAIGQYDCDRAGHLHGDDSHARDERATAYAFQLPLQLARVVDRLAAACPEAIVDFDVTESHRCVGLAFLAAGKYFLLNNGPYFWNFDYPFRRDVEGNNNLLFMPGRARPWFMRAPLDYDRWIPSVLFLTHYFPDDPAEQQDGCAASLVLGQNGIWGDLLSISEAGVERLGRQLAQYKLVRDDVTRATLVRTGLVGGSPEVYEKLADNGRGVVCLFACHAGTYTHVTAGRVTTEAWHDGTGVTVTDAGDGRAKIEATFAKGEWGKLVVFT